MKIAIILCIQILFKFAGQMDITDPDLVTVQPFLRHFDQTSLTFAD